MSFLSPVALRSTDRKSADRFYRTSHNHIPTIILYEKRIGGCTAASEVAPAGEYGVEDARHRRLTMSLYAPATGNPRIVLL